MTHAPGMADADGMVDIAQSKLEELVGEDAACVGKAKQTVVRENGPQTHGPGMQYSLIAQTAQTGMSVYDLDALANDDVAEDGEEGEDGRKGGLAVYNEKRYVVDFEAIGEVPHARPASVSVGDDDDFVAAVNEFLELVRTRQTGVAAGLTLDSWYMWLSTPPVDCMRHA
jgi:hypothetical protein